MCFCVNIPKGDVLESFFLEQGIEQSTRMILDSAREFTRICESTLQKEEDGQSQEKDYTFIGKHWVGVVV